MKTNLLAALAVVLTIGLAHAEPARHPEGVYHNSFSGGFSGSEWFEVRAVAGAAGRYRFADIYGGGFDATISGEAITIDNDIGSGRFTGPDSFVLTPTLGGERFIFESRRAPATATDFPLVPFAAQSGDKALSGRWLSRTVELDARSGVEIGGGEEALILTVDGERLRITDPAGLYFEGVFDAARSAVFRVTEGAPVRSPQYATIRGSAINFEQDMLGRVVFQDTDHFAATFLLQSRAPLGEQKQRLVTFEARRCAQAECQGKACCE